MNLLLAYSLDALKLYEDKLDNTQRLWAFFLRAHLSTNEPRLLTIRLIVRSRNSNGDRLYQNFMSGDWAFEEAVSFM